MKAAEWIDRVKKARQIDSDYAAAKALGLSRAAISMYRSRASTLDEKTAISVAEALGERPELILLDQAAERTKDAGARTALLKLARDVLGGSVYYVKSRTQKVHASGTSSRSRPFRESASLAA